MPDATTSQPIAVHRYGTPGAPPLVLVHGLTDAGTAWPDAVAHWSAAWDIYAVDQRGHGDSPRFTERELRGTPDVLVADLIDVLEGIGRPAVVVGHSLGGLTSARVAAARPELVRALVVEDPAKPVGEWRPDPEFSAMNLDFVQRMTDEAARKAEIDEIARKTMWTRDEIIAWADCKAQVDQRFLADGLFLGSPEWEGLFDRLRIPTLVVVPPDSTMTPRAELISNPLVRIETVEQAGHCVRRDNPARYFEVVDEFLARARVPRFMVTSLTIGTDDVAALADFYSRLLDEPVIDSESSDGVMEWAQVRAHWPGGRVTLNIEHERYHQQIVWPSRPGEPLTQVHLDIQVDDLETAETWAIQNGARLASEQPLKGVRVLIDPAGHPFCIFE